MANISDAEGTMSLYCANKDDLQTIVSFLKSKEGYEYCTTFYEEEQPGEETWRGWFYGAGRWTYENNLECFFNEFKDIEKLDDFQIEVNFVDYEPGNVLFFEEDGKFVHIKGQGVKYKVISVQDIEPNWGERLYYHKEDEEGLECLLEGMTDEEIYQTFDEQRESLENFYLKPLDDIVKKHFSEQCYEAYERGKANAE